MRGLPMKARRQSSSNTEHSQEPEHPRTEADATSYSDTSTLFTLFKGLLLSVLSGAVFSLISVLIKHMKNIHPGQLAVYSIIGISVFSLPQAVKSQVNLLGPRELRFLLILRGIAGATAVFLNYIAYRYLPIGESTVIILSVPIFVTITARVFLKESCGVVQSIAVIITVVGIIFVAKVPAALSGRSVDYSWEYIYGLLASFGSVICGTCRIITLRKLKSVHHSVTVFFSGVVALLETTVLTALFGRFDFHNCGLPQILIILLGIFSYASTTLHTMSLQSELAGPVSTVLAGSNIILCFVWQTFIFRDAPDVFSIAGAVLVLVGVVLVGLKKCVSSLPSDSTRAKHLRFLTE